jgi:Phosphotyrosine interaction domain (PTB/PID)
LKKPFLLHLGLFFHDTEWRACYVIECGNEMAQSIITAMGHAFELRYREYYGAEK